MSKILSILGLDAEDIKWYHLAACLNMHVNNFYDNYENDQKLAKQIDEMCMVCPVANKCYNEGVENKEKGVWGGVYLDLGRVDKQNNSHKTPDIWKRLKKIHGKSIL
jgi:hypothetical protein